MLEAGRTCWSVCWRVSETLRGTRGAAPIGRRGPDVEGGGGGGGALPTGGGTGGFPDPSIVVGRLGISIEGFVHGRAGTSIVEAGRSAG